MLSVRVEAVEGLELKCFDGSSSGGRAVESILQSVLAKTSAPIGAAEV